MQYLLRIHDYDDAQYADRELGRFLKTLDWHQLALVAGQLVGTAVSDLDSAALQSALSQYFFWPARVLAAPIDPGSAPLTREQLPEWLATVGQPGTWTEGLLQASQ